MTRLLCVTAAVLASIPSTAQASPGISKKGGTSTTTTSQAPTSSAERDQAMATLREGERLVQMNDGDKLVEGLGKMLEAYLVLEKTDGAEASGVKELRSWLVKALETADLKDEAKPLRDRGSYIDHPLSIMPSTWFPEARKAQAPAPSNLDAALEEFGAGLDMLKQGNYEGLGKLLSAYEVIEDKTGAESEESVLVRSFIVNLLEYGGFSEPAAKLRARGSVTPPTAEDKQVYEATWKRIIEAEQGKGQSGSSGSSGPSSSGSSSGSSGSSSSGSSSGGIISLKGGDSGSSSSGSSSSGSSSSGSSNSGSSSDDDEDKKRRGGAFQKGSIIPSVFLDFGLGSWRPETGDKGFIWTVDLQARWRVFTVKFFGLEVGGGGRIGRNRDKRWLTDAGGTLGLALDFGKFYLVPEAGGGYDGLTGGDEPMSLRIAPNGYYNFGGRLGIRFGDKYGLYGRAMRVNRLDDVMTNETRVRVGFTVDITDTAELDLAFVFDDYESSVDEGGARMYTGNFGFRF